MPTRLQERREPPVGAVSRVPSSAPAWRSRPDPFLIDSAPVFVLGRALIAFRADRRRRAECGPGESVNSGASVSEGMGWCGGGVTCG
jgi:hypothetical protein